jgi:hypothetical protein
MASAYYDINAQQYSTLNFHVEYYDENGDAVDLSGYTARFHVRPNNDSSKLYLMVTTSGVTSGGSTGEFGATGGISGSGINIGGGGESTFKYTRNMGAYCSMHGHHPVGANHTSATCTHKQERHNDTATADHRFGGSNFWPGLSKVKSSQHDHISYKGKSAPN